MDKKLKKQVDNHEKAIEEITKVLVNRFDEADDVALAVTTNIISSMYGYEKPAPPVPTTADKFKASMSKLGDFIKWIFVKKGYYSDSMRVGWAWVLGILIAGAVALGIYGIVSNVPETKYPYTVTIGADYKFNGIGNSCVQGAGCVQDALRGGIDNQIENLKEGESFTTSINSSYRWTFTRKGALIEIEVNKQ